ncbi:MAG: GIY-YIG nuclease family protein [Bacteroidota bacterium]|nr:GIY-YIG nuclease family protein [Bacteroidota bacterium]
MRALSACFYVGSSTRTPDERFDQHKQGYKSNRYARKFGMKLRPDLFAQYNPIPSRNDALELEEYLADRLRGQGYGVWQGETVWVCSQGCRDTKKALKQIHPLLVLNGQNHHSVSHHAIPQNLLCGRRSRSWPARLGSLQ